MYKNNFKMKKKFIWNYSLQWSILTLLIEDTKRGVWEFLISV